MTVLCYVYQQLMMKAKAQDEVQHWVPGLTSEDKRMITNSGWLSDYIGEKLLNASLYTRASNGKHWYGPVI